MENTLYVGLSHQIGLRKLLDVTANNIANANTDGFRADRLSFHELVAKPEKTPALSFSEPINITPDPAEGTLKQTNNPLDFAIQGEGYFAIQTPAGTQYTRAGRFTISLDNELITNHGYPVLDTNNQPITLPNNYENIGVTAQGLLVVDGLQISEIGVYNFENPGDISKAGDTLFQAHAEPFALPNKILKQGYVEGSNVQSITELIKLIQIERDNKYTKNLIEIEDDLSKRSIDAFTRT